MSRLCGISGGTPGHVKFLHLSFLIIIITTRAPVEQFNFIRFPVATDANSDRLFITKLALIWLANIKNTLY